MDRHPIASSGASSRPYRSHKVPACDVCRKRKIQCRIDEAGQRCRFCRERDVACHFSQKEDNRDNDIQPRSKRKAMEPHQATRVGPHPVSEPIAGGNGISPDESSVIMNPTMAEDIEVVEHYLPPEANRDGATTKLYSLVPSAEGKPIIYLTVPRRRRGLRTDTNPGSTQREILEQILGSLKETVIRLFFEHVSPCFPVVDEAACWRDWEQDASKISSALLCDIYASTLIFWDRSSSLRLHTRPDMTFAWNQAVMALQEDFMAPSITTVQSALLDLMGRPVLSVTGNIVNAGRTVTLANSLGLNRDPTSWAASSENDKNLRIRLWWALVVNDFWSSLAHGIPSNICPSNYDTPLPSVASIAGPSATEEMKRAAASFVHLCTLTQILADLNPLVYSLKETQKDMGKKIRRLECDLDSWEESLPDFLRLDSGGVRTEHVNGSSNLWFCFLSLKVLLCRCAFRASCRSDPNVDSTGKEAKNYRLAMLRDSALTLTLFVSELTETQMNEFWVSYATHLLVSSTTVLLRCTIESADINTKRRCTGELVKMIYRLQASHWDLGEFCLERCTEPVMKLAAALGIAQTPAMQSSQQERSVVEQLSEPAQLATSHAVEPSDALSMFIPADSLDFPWETLWDTFGAPESTTERFE
ncbi:hypothetical protein D0869_08489 [Hortaea werneckii]|uniref:Zn(2)-C6 fungal-type domain-containing protein n=1 Tax=Hortaea werneckii TaxID=91943 RepID=A0A3M6WKU9_HORWE|nr:hypothetical protein D0869_08489 [Hortaea werneckii]RMY12464.1 hypothetical protein D0868_02565 [Hortaea werneckii]